MSDICVAYWSGTGNTEAMAQAIGAGITAAGKSADVVPMETISPADLKDQAVWVLGCPAMGDEVLEDTEFEPMFDGCKDALKGKNIALFGSYGWGDGEWMRNWEESCKEAGANLVCDSVICQEEPDDEATDACKALGAALV
mgnify:CR=1 FL=1